MKKQRWKFTKTVKCKCAECNYQLYVPLNKYTKDASVTCDIFCHMVYVGKQRK